MKAYLMLPVDQYPVKGKVSGRYLFICLMFLYNSYEHKIQLINSPKV